MTKEVKDIKIRKATKKDFKEMVKIMRTEFRKKPWNEKWARDIALKVIKNYISDGRSYVAIKDKKIIGYILITESIYIDGPVIDIETLVVLEKFQKQGIGTALLKKAEEDYKKKGASKIYIETMKKAYAYRFYKKRGYKNSKYDVLVEKEIV